MWVLNFRTCLQGDEAEARNKDDVEEQTKMNAILRILEKYYPHSVSEIEIASFLNLSAEKVDLFLGFLAKYSVISYNERIKTAVICDDFLSLK